MADKVTTMVLKVDLQCSCCVKKIKKVLCKFPQIRDRVYDEKQNTVTITVVCCNPEKLRDKLCCKGGKTIKSIEIKEPPKTKEPEKDKVPEKDKKPKQDKVPEKDKEPEKAVKEAPTPVYVPVLPCYPYPNYPLGDCCTSCSEGHPGGPCYQGYGRPVQSYDNYGSYGYGYGGGRTCYTRCESYCEDNPSGCAIM